MKVIALPKENFKEEVKTAAAVLQKGGVIACPTDTVYGLLVDATNKKAVEKIFLIKRREKGKPLPIFVKNIAMAKKIAKVSLAQEKYMDKAWPGKVTLILESRGALVEETGTKEHIGLRIPKHKFIEAILKEIGIPLTGTSANLAGKPSLSDSKDIVKVFKKRKYRPDIVFDVGKLPRSKPSRVIDITEIQPKILRK